MTPFTQLRLSRLQTVHLISDYFLNLMEFSLKLIIEYRMLFEPRQQENTKPAITVVKVTPQSLAALVKSQKAKGLIPATLHTNDAGEKVFRPIFASLNY